MKKTGQMIASAAIAALATGTLGSGILVLSTHEASARSGHSSSGGSGSSSRGNSENARSATHGKSEGKGKGVYHKLSARYLKNLNAMCSKGGGHANSKSNVAKIEAFFTTKDAADTAYETISYDDAVSYLDTAGDGGGSYESDGTTYDQLTNEERDAIIAALDAQQSLTGDQQNLYDALVSYDAGRDQYDALVTAVRGSGRADALLGAPSDSPEYAAYQTFLAHCAPQAN